MSFSLHDDQSEKPELEKNTTRNDIDWVEEALARVDVDRDEFEAGMDDLKQEFDGLVQSDDAAAILMARRLDVDLVDELRQRNIGLEVENVVPGMSDVTLKCKVDAIQSLSQFDGGQVRSAVVSDDTGQTQASFWDEDAEALEAVERGDLLLIKGAYTKKEVSDWQKNNYNGIPAIQIGDETAVEIKSGEGDWAELVAQDSS